MLDGALDCIASAAITGVGGTAAVRVLVGGGTVAVGVGTVTVSPPLTGVHGIASSLSEQRATASPVVPGTSDWMGMRSSTPLLMLTAFTQARPSRTTPGLFALVVSWQPGPSGPTTASPLTRTIALLKLMSMSAASVPLPALNDRSM